MIVKFPRKNYYWAIVKQEEAGSEKNPKKPPFAKGGARRNGRGIQPTTCEERNPPVTAVTSPFTRLCR